MDSTVKIRWFITFVIWFAVIGFCIFIFNRWLPYYLEEQKKFAVEKQLKEELEKTSSAPRSRWNIKFGIDNFSGYSIFTSKTFLEECDSHNIQIQFENDKGNSAQRLKLLSTGDLDLAVISLTSLVKSIDLLKASPVSIIAIVNESVGADAIIVSNDFENINSLVDADVKFHYRSNSTCEMLIRKSISQYNIGKFGSDCLRPYIFDNDLKKSICEDTNNIVCVHEPFIDSFLDENKSKVLIDSSKFEDYPVHVLVARRAVIVNNSQLISQILKNYFLSAFKERNNLKKLIEINAGKNNILLNQDRLDSIAKSIVWKNTQDNYAHFGITQGTGLPNIELLCKKAINDLIKNQMIKSDPTLGNVGTLYFDGIIKSLYNEKWFPGYEDVQKQKELPPLTDEDWLKTKVVKSLQTNPSIMFIRGIDKFSLDSTLSLSNLFEQIKSSPQFYIVIKAHIPENGDPEANLKLAENRAKVIKQWLVDNGISTNRIKTETIRSNSHNHVSFDLIEQTY